ncbi:MAG: hypothetical protein EOO88_62730 [Pedobacter sp.]|nr:MAG: hypothetical protein EOO88_62730 [Pedobacter sp.]
MQDAEERGEFEYDPSLILPATGRNEDGIVPIANRVIVQQQLLDARAVLKCSKIQCNPSMLIEVIIVYPNLNQPPFIFL